jgi:hypothetical protein
VGQRREATGKNNRNASRINLRFAHDALDLGSLSASRGRARIARQLNQKLNGFGRVFLSREKRGTWKSSCQGQGQSRSIEVSLAEEKVLEKATSISKSGEEIGYVEARARRRRRRDESEALGEGLIVKLSRSCRVAWCWKCRRRRTQSQVCGGTR